MRDCFVYNKRYTAVNISTLRHTTTPENVGTSHKREATKEEAEGEPECQTVCNGQKPKKTPDNPTALENQKLTMGQLMTHKQYLARSGRGRRCEPATQRLVGGGGATVQTREEATGDARAVSHSVAGGRYGWWPLCHAHCGNQRKGTRSPTHGARPVPRSTTTTSISESPDNVKYP